MGLLHTRYAMFSTDGASQVVELFSFFQSVTEHGPCCVGSDLNPVTQNVDTSRLRVSGLLHYS